MAKMNEESITWGEWLAASFCQRFTGNRKIYKRLQKAWQDGEDPSEWRAWAESQG